MSWPLGANCYYLVSWLVTRGRNLASFKDDLQQANFLPWLLWMKCRFHWAGFWAKVQLLSMVGPLSVIFSLPEPTECGLWWHLMLYFLACPTPWLQWSATNTLISFKYNLFLYCRIMRERTRGTLPAISFTMLFYFWIILNFGLNDKKGSGRRSCPTKGLASLALCWALWELNTCLIITWK